MVAAFCADSEENDGLALCCTLVLKICHCKTWLVTSLLHLFSVHLYRSINIYIHTARYSKV